MRIISRLLISFFLMSCVTKGHLEYITVEGELKTACETEYSWAPAVDRYAVQYILSHCAKKAAKLGHKVVDESLLLIDLSIAKSPDGLPWTFEKAKAGYAANQLTDKEYGYIVAAIDLGLVSN